MFGLKQGINGYTQVGIETGVAAANPNKLIVMLYDGAVQACQSASIHMRQKDIEKKSESISKAIMIIESGLRASLDKKVGGEIAESLDALYEYMSNRLYMANIKNDPELLGEVVRLLIDLRTAWEAIGQSSPKPNAQVVDILSMAGA